MAIIYVVAVIYILVTNLTHIPAMIGNIISQAFGTREVLGGTFGAVVMNGVRRGLFLMKQEVETLTMQQQQFI